MSDTKTNVKSDATDFDDRHLPVADAATVRAAFWQLVRGDRRAVALLLVLNLAAAGAGLAMPWLLGRIIDVVQDGGGAARVDRLAFALLGCAVAQLLLTRYAFYAGYRFGERGVAALREDFVDRTVRLPAPVVERAGTGDLTTRSTTDIVTVGTTLREALPEVFIALVELTVMFAVLFFLHPLFGLCAAVGLPCFVLVTRWYLRRAPAAYLAEGAANSDLTENIAATAEGARTTEALGLRRRRAAASERRIAEAHRTRTRTLALRSVFFPGVDVTHALPMAAMLLLGGVLVLEGWTSLGSAVTACLYVVRVVEPVDTILMQVEQLQSSTASLARIKGVECVARSATEESGDADQPYAPPDGDLLELRGVRYAYHQGRDVVRGVDLTVRPGERLALVGPSGSGKSTLARLLAGVEAPTAGGVTVGGAPVAALPPEVRRRRVVLVTQEYHVFQETLRFNLAIAEPEAGEDEMWDALHAVGAGEWTAELPYGLDTRVGVNAGGGVGGGSVGGTLGLDAAQSQQLALARVVLADPHTVILDEATAMLDPRTARQTERSFAAVLSGRTVIAIAHRLQTAHDADRVAVMEDGRLTELGSHDALLGADGAYASLWRSWHGG